jgi:signal transduction histidine kinase
MTLQLRRIWIAAAAILVLLSGTRARTQTHSTVPDQAYEHAETRDLVALVNDAASLIRSTGDAAFADFRVPGSRWHQEETYIFVLDRRGTMLVHPDTTMEGTNQIALKDVAGKPIVEGLIGAATVEGKSGGWYHYQWPVPGGLLPRWKSSYVRLVQSPSGASYIVGSGMYNDRMERAFVVDAVATAVAEVERNGERAFSRFRDATGPFIAKDAYVFVLDADGIDLVNPAFPNLEGRSLADWKDVLGKPLIREMLEVARTSGSGWVDYMWPKPGESVSTKKSAYVRRARFGDKTLIVGSGVYLADAPKSAPLRRTVTAKELTALVREGAAALEQRGQRAYAEFRQQGSKWLHDDTYFFVWLMDGTMEFHGADPQIEGRNDLGIKDIHGRPFGKMIREAASTPGGEGWVHYMYPQPGDIFPTWKSTFVKRVTLPGGTERLIGCGIFNMQMDRAFIEDVVDRAADLVAARGRDAFPALRDKTGPFVFMDTYVFIDSPDGVELVNPGQPSLEGRNISGVTDLKGKKLVDEYIAAAMRDGTAWVQYYWYLPGSNTSASKQTFVRKVQFGGETFIVGSGFYGEEEPTTSEPYDPLCPGRCHAQRPEW